MHGATAPAAPAVRTQPQRLQRLYQHWDDRRRGREFPARADFTPHDLQYIIGNLSLVDVGYQPLSFRFRIFASNVATRLGKEMTNKSVDAFPYPRQAELAREHFTEVVERRVPAIRFRDPSFIKYNVPRNFEILALPLSADGKIIDMLMVGYAWDKE
jgi:hypothetical protein